MSEVPLYLDSGIIIFFIITLRNSLQRPPPLSRVVKYYRKVDVRLPGKGNSNSHSARPVHLIITTIKWIRTSRLSIQNSLSE